MTQVDDFEILNLVALGTYGQVFRVRKNLGKDENRLYAMKVIKKTGKPIDQMALSERRILEVVRHPFIVELVYAFQTSKRFHLVLEFCWGNLTFLTKRKSTKISEKFISFYMKETILAVQHLHDNEIVHRDIKPENVLIDMNGHVKLIDFGCSANLVGGKQLNKLCGTFGYMAPEILSGSSYGKVVDWFSLGVVFYEMLMNRPLFIELNRDKLLKFILEREYLESMNNRLSETARDLISGLLRVDPSQRLGFFGVREIQEHIFFKQTNWDKVLNKCEKPPFVPSYSEERFTVTNVNFFANEDVGTDKEPKPFYREFDYHSSNLDFPKSFPRKSMEKFAILEENEVPFYERSDNVSSDRCCQIL